MANSAMLMISVPACPTSSSVCRGGWQVSGKVMRCFSKRND
jgi:hypothetical protein